MASVSTASSLLFPSRNFNSIRLIPRRTSSLSFIRCSLRNPTAEEDILRFVAESDGKVLPCVRTYENNSARLSLLGTVAFDQALTAAAADGGEAADDHLRDNIPVMVVETIFPGGSDPKATLSTRLFLPTQKVRERAKRLRRSLSKDLSSEDLSKNILAMTFRQVVLRNLWNFKLVLFGPGAEREMGDYENPREVSTSFSLSSSDERVISVIAEVICISALQTTEKHFLHDYLGKAKFPFLKWLNKSRKIASRDSSVVLHKLFDEDITNHLLEYFQSRKEDFKIADTRQRSRWWTLPVNSKLEKIGGPGFSNWASEYLPAYRLELDTRILGDLKLEGWRKSSENKWEVLLTHSQMVGLAEALDIYFEDTYTLPRKQLPCDYSGNYADLPNGKRGLSLLKMISITMASGILLLAVTAAAQFCFPQQRERKYPGKNQHSLWSESELLSHQSSDSSALDSFCELIINKLKDAYDWGGEITLESSIGASIGEVPEYLKETRGAEPVEEEHIATSSSLLEKLNEDAKASALNIATYQVVLSSEGRIIGFQPMSRVAVNHWAANPLAKELYNGRKLSPGLIERGLKSRQPPTNVVVLELLMSVDSVRPFALVRPLLR